MPDDDEVVLLALELALLELEEAPPPDDDDDVLPLDCALLVDELDTLAPPVPLLADDSPTRGS